uniref:HEAT repeat domain-containing protein n=1 Tax=Schlesneria paludicola TaxID=360056 RepID=A0A7C2K1M4_9PLAN
MRRLSGFMAGMVCAATFGCGGGSPQPAATTPRTAAAPTASSGALPDLQPVPPQAESPDSPSSAAVGTAGELFHRWVAAAQANDPEAWSQAEQDLQTVGEQAVPALIPVLSGADPLAREMAVMFLAQLGPQAEPAAEALTGLLNDPSPLVRVNAAGVLTTFENPPESAVTVLVDLLSDEDVNIRTTAAGCLGNVTELSSAALRRLVDGLDDADPRMRAAAATTLSRSGQKAAAALSKLRLLTGDDDEAVRQAATLAVKLIDSAGRSEVGGAVPVGATEEK